MKPPLVNVEEPIDHASDHERASREPTLEDLRDLCRALNDRGARYIVIGGFAVRAAGDNRRTTDVDLLVAADSDNESRVFDAQPPCPIGQVMNVNRGPAFAH